MEEQREGLRNAMVLGRLLNRTVLVPPLWVGTVRSSWSSKGNGQKKLKIISILSLSLNLSNLTLKSFLVAIKPYPQQNLLFSTKVIIEN